MYIVCIWKGLGGVTEAVGMEATGLGFLGKYGTVVMGCGLVAL